MTEMKKETNAKGKAGKVTSSRVEGNNMENKAMTSCCNAPSKETSSYCTQTKAVEKTTV
jgi:hypothetical protein